MLNKQSPKKSISKDFFKNKNLINSLLEKVEEFSKIHIENQIENGADVIQIFDSWVGLLEEKDLDKFCYAPTLNLVNFVKSKNIPVICFPRGIKDYKKYCDLIKPDGINIDYEVNPLKIKNEIQDITIHQTKNSKDLVMNCDLLINISPELYDSSTIMLEGLILEKPVIQFILDDEFLNIQPLNSPIIQMNELNELIEVTEKILENETFKETIIKKIPLQIANYLSYQNSSSHIILELIEKTPD